MFVPFNMLEIVSGLYDSLDVAQKCPRNTKLAYKDHRALPRHQQAYSDMTPLLLSFVAGDDAVALRNYLANAQHFFCHLNEAPYETELSPDAALNVYWECLFAPMLATLLFTFRHDETQPTPINHIGRLLLTWESSKTPGERARWVKEAIKQQYEIKAPLFTQQINDIRGDSVQSRETIKNNLAILHGEINHLPVEEQKEILLRVSAVYHAAMIIRRLEENGNDAYLMLVREQLSQLHHDDITELLALHLEISQIMVANHNYTLFQWGGSELITRLDDFIFSSLEPSYPGVIDVIKSQYNDPAWPDEGSLTVLLCLHADDLLNSTPLTVALTHYWIMYQYVDQGKFDDAYQHCLTVEELAKSVHLGRFNSYNLLHKVVLYWAINGKMQHGQFSEDITKIIMTLPDELDFIATINPKVQQLVASFDDEELMMVRLFRLFNQRHRHNTVSPFKKLAELIHAALETCADNELPITELLPVFKKKIDKNILRTPQALPFSKRLSLSESLDIAVDLYALVNIHAPYEFFEFEKSPRCKALILAAIE